MTSVLPIKSGETERFRAELAKVRAELDPWEKQLMDHKGKLEVASTERKLLTEKVKLKKQNLIRCKVHLAIHNIHFLK